MMRTAGAVVAGAAAALAAPRWIDGPRLTELLGPPASPRPAAPVPRGAMGAAMRLLYLLSRLPRSPWRNTCLFRSVAECLVLRRYGVPAVLCIGVRSEGAESDIEAHAWVVRAGDPSTVPAARGHVPLSARA